MRHYEIVLVVHPDRSVQVPAMVERYQKLIKDHHGKIHRFEDWGRRQMAYSINRVHKGHYLLMNIECDDEMRKELEHSFHYNDSILRHIILKVDKVVAMASPMMQEVRNKDQRKRYDHSDRSTSSSSAARSVDNERSDKVEKVEKAEKAEKVISEDSENA